MTRIALALLLALTAAPLSAQSILVDHRSVALFDSIPQPFIAKAQALRMLFMDRSVGGNISDALDCLAMPFASAPTRCKRWQHSDTAYAVDPSEVMWNGVWSRANWRYEFWPATCSEDPRCFISFIEPRIDSFDVVGFQFSYLAVAQGSRLADSIDGFFGSRPDRGTAAVYADFAARHPGTRVLWWTTSLARGIGSPESEAFNNAMRQYAAMHDVILFDVADILSHSPDGGPCFDNRDGRPYLTENHPDDSLDIPAICPHYTTETEGGHLGAISAGGIRVAKAFWVLMARIAGWDGRPQIDTTTFSATPITEMVTSLYKSVDGGLYGLGSNLRPAAHEAEGLRRAHAIQPLDTLGLPDAARGRIVLLSIGMSNTTQEYSAFTALADTFALRNPRLVVVDGAQGGQTASIIRNPSASFWNVVEQRLRSAGVSSRQVQAVWLKEANAGPTMSFPGHALELRDDLAAICRLLPQKFPNVQLTHLSSRTYGGYATTTLNPEPYAYESGFSVQWLIRAQIDGDTALAYGTTPPRAPWLAWGPYLWASGATPRADGLVWLPGDCGSDGTHPSTSGRLKVATLLLDFYRSDPTATPWFVQPVTEVEVPGAAPAGSELGVSPNPIVGSAIVAFRMRDAGTARLDVVDILGRCVATLLDGRQEPGVVRVPCNARALGLAPGVHLIRLTTAQGMDMVRLVVQ